jgi:adenosylmethionine-8-amino-7-oxononanoate aminotransferase
MSPAQIRHLSDADRRFVWHPFTQMQDYASAEPLIIERGEGAYLYDVHGRRYLDAFSSVWCNVHGHRVGAIDDAIRDQLGRVAHSTLLGMANVPSIRLAEALVRIAPPGLSHVFYSDSGAAAVEVALKIAFQYWRQRKDPRPGKRRFLHLADSYHGDTVGAMSLGGIDLFHGAYGSLLFESLTVPAPHPYRCSYCSEARVCDRRCLAALDDILSREADTLAAFVVEPLVQGAGGMLVHPDGYLREAAALCRRHDVLLIVDEVATGFGRTGAMFASEREGVTPDLLCLGKGLSGGVLPLAATLATDSVYAAFLGEYAERKTFFHGHTFAGNPLGCAAALASLELFERDRVLDALPQKIERLGHGLERFRGLPHVGDVRQCGMIAAIELVADRASRRPFPFEARIGHRVCDHARESGVLLRPLGGTLVLFPPLCITVSEIDFLLDVLHAAVKKVAGP